MTERRAQRPSLEDLDRELANRSRSRRYCRAVRGTVWILIVVAAGAILCSTFLLSVLKVQGSSMEPTLRQGEVLLAVRKSRFHSGDVIAFYYNNKILLKRVAAESGDEVDIGKDGTVTVNGETLDEPYLLSKSLGNCDISLPEQVPDGRVFVLGDNRGESVDSRSSVIGCISEKAVVGKVVLRIWPLSELGAI
jgi:signal peptidase I